MRWNAKVSLFFDPNTNPLDVNVVSHFNSGDRESYVNLGRKAALSTAFHSIDNIICVSFSHIYQIYVLCYHNSLHCSDMPFASDRLSHPVPVQ